METRALNNDTEPGYGSPKVQPPPKGKDAVSYSSRSLRFDCRIFVIQRRAEVRSRPSLCPETIGVRAYPDAVESVGDQVDQDLTRGVAEDVEAVIPEIKVCSAKSVSGM